MVSHPENGSDSPIGSDRDRGRDNMLKLLSVKLSYRCLTRLAYLAIHWSRVSYSPFTYLTTS